MHEDIVEFIKEKQYGATSKEITEKFLKFKNPPDTYASTAVKGILSNDNRCFQDESGKWFVNRDICSSTGLTFEKMSLSTVYILCNNDTENRKVAYIAIWDIFPEPIYKFGAWLSDPEKIKLEYGDIITEGPEEKYDSSMYNLLIEKINKELIDRTPVHFTFNESQAVSGILGIGNENYIEGSILVGEMLFASKLSSDMPLSLELLSNVILKKYNYPVSAFRQSEIFSQCIYELINILGGKGIRTRADLIKNVYDNHIFKDKGFFYEDLTKLPLSQGVYGFKDQEGKSIYIGRCKNLRNRFLNHFRTVDSSSKNINWIQKKSYSFDIFQCGSELEALLFEYRLIKKHNPVANKTVKNEKQIQHFDSFDDCLVVLPHADLSKCVSFWLRENQKIFIKSLTISSLNNSELVKDIREFFFENRFNSDKNDLHEWKIAVEWIKINLNLLFIIVIKKKKSVEEIFDSLKAYSNDFYENN